MLIWDKRHSRFSAAGSFVVMISCFAIFRPWLPVVAALMLSALAAMLFYYAVMRRFFRRRRVCRHPFPPVWRKVLLQQVRFYSALNADDRLRFENDVMIFLDENRITPVATSIDETIRVLVAASAVMLLFGHPQWEYSKLPEILIYPTAFDEHYSISTKARPRSDLAGIIVPQTGIIITKDELLAAFEQGHGSSHVALHEFAHALDMADGIAEGIPADLPYRLVSDWQDLISDELARVRSRNSVLDPYAGKNRGELFAVAVEHFFQSPGELQEHHARLYAALVLFFNQDPARSAGINHGGTGTGS